MSDCVGSNCSHSCRDAPLDNKPKHVRRLNFGQSILKLDAVEECYASNHVLAIDQNVAHIPCTEKKDYVRKWIETHQNDEHDVMSSDDDSSQSSPILGTSATKVSKTSPIFKNSRKRPRGKIRINRHVKVKKVSGVDCQENTKHIINCAMKYKLDCESKEKNKNIQENFSKTQCTLPCTEKIVTDEISPTIGSKSLKLHDNKSTSINSVILPDKNCNVLKDISIDDKLKKNVKINHGATTLFSTETKNSEIHQKYRGPFSSITQEKSWFQYDSTDNTDKDNPKIEISTSDDSKDEKCDKLSSTHSSSNNNLSNLIEEIDTQEDTQKSQFSVSDKSLTPLKQPFMILQLAADDSDETYCSEVETMQDQSIHLSAKISEVPSLDKITQKTGSRTTQTDVIINTPSKKSPDKSMYAHLLNSEKKRRKPKKGSIVAKLQSLVKAQVSDIRIWRHRINKEQDIDERFISILVRNCTKRFNNQFLDSVLIEDRFNLLQTNAAVKNIKLQNVEVESKEALYKNIMILLVCDIVGTLKIMSQAVINVYPPWNILDKDNLTIEAMYISISDNQDVSDIANNSYKCKKRIVKEFNCPCIEEQRELPFCSRKPNSDKPDVMQRIFDF